MSNEKDKLTFTVAVKTGLVAILLATILIIVDGWLAVIPLAGFFLLCLAAPFFPRFGFYLPVICKGASGKKAVAITFDDGPDPLTTPLLLELLLKRQIEATFFVTGKKAAARWRPQQEGPRTVPCPEMFPLTETHSYRPWRPWAAERPCPAGS